MAGGRDGAGGARRRAPPDRGRGAGGGVAGGLVGGRGPSPSPAAPPGGGAAAPRLLWGEVGRAAPVGVGLLLLALLAYFTGPRLSGRRPASRGDLNALLRQGEPDSNECLRDLKGSFFQQSDAVLQQVSLALKAGTGLVWARWGDGEMLAVNEDKPGEGQVLSAQLQSSLLALSTDPLAVVNIGVFWLCEPILKKSWELFTRQHEAAFGDSDAARAAFQSFFYLPAGDPADSDRAKWRQLGVPGWSEAVLRRKRTLVLVGPPHLRDIPLFKDAVFVNAHDPNMGRDPDRVEAWLRELKAQADLLEPPFGRQTYWNRLPGILCIVAAGPRGKVLMARLLEEFAHGRGWAIVDVGASLDGYAGVHSRDFNDPFLLCQRARENASEEEIRLWFAPGWCEKQNGLLLPWEGSDYKTSSENKSNEDSSDEEEEGAGEEERGEGEGGKPQSVDNIMI